MGSPLNAASPGSLSCRYLPLRADFLAGRRADFLAALLRRGVRFEAAFFLDDFAADRLEGGGRFFAFAAARFAGREAAFRAGRLAAALLGALVAGFAAVVPAAGFAGLAALAVAAGLASSCTANAPP